MSVHCLPSALKYKSCTLFQALQRGCSDGLLEGIKEGRFDEVGRCLLSLPFQSLAWYLRLVVMLRCDQLLLSIKTLVTGLNLFDFMLPSPCSEGSIFVFSGSPDGSF